MTLRIDFWHDFSCPWCRIGLHNLESAIASAGVPVELVIHPYLLDPEAPEAGADLRERLAAKYGAAVLQPMFERVTAAGAQAGVTFDWDRVRVAPQTVAAHAVTASLPPERQRAWLHAVHEAYFVHGRNIGDLDVLYALASELDWDADAIRAAARSEEARRGVLQALEWTPRTLRGVPHTRVGTQELSGAQPPERFVEVLMAAAREQASSTNGGGMR